MKKSTITILLVLTALVFTSCLTSTTASSLSMGQNAKDGSAYLIGSFHTELLNEKILPKGKDFGYITFVGLSGDSEGQEIKRKISRNDVFFLELPAGEYLLKSITYFDVIDVESLGSLSFGKGMRVTPVNTFTAGTTVDLSDSSFTYIGDITFVNKTNPYGISEKTIAVYDNYQSILSDEWLLDGSGRAISPENKSGETVMGSALYDPFNYQIGNGRLSFDKDTALETSAGGRYSYAPDKSIAFISVDNNYGSWAIASEMKKYALETYNTKVVDSQSMARVLPQYPALTPTPLNEETGSYTSERNIIDFYMALGSTLEVDYLYTINQIAGGTEYGFAMDGTQDLSELSLQMRSVLFDVNKGEFVATATSSSSERDLPFFATLGTGATYEGLIFETISKYFVDELYK